MMLGLVGQLLLIAGLDSDLNMPVERSRSVRLGPSSTSSAATTLPVAATEDPISMGAVERGGVVGTTLPGAAAEDLPGETIDYTDRRECLASGAGLLILGALLILASDRMFKSWLRGVE